MESNGVLSTTRFSHRKGLGTCDALLCVSHTLQSALESGQEAGSYSLISNRQEILCKLCPVGIGCSVL